MRPRRPPPPKPPRVGQRASNGFQKGAKRHRDVMNKVRLGQWPNRLPLPPEAKRRIKDLEKALKIDEGPFQLQVRLLRYTSKNQLHNIECTPGVLLVTGRDVYFHPEMTLDQLTGQRGSFWGTSRVNSGQAAMILSSKTVRLADTDSRSACFILRRGSLMLVKVMTAGTRDLIDPKKLYSKGQCWLFQITGKQANPEYKALPKADFLGFPF